MAILLQMFSSVQGGPKRTVFWKFVTRVYDDEETQLIYKELNLM